MSGKPIIPQTGEAEHHLLTGIYKPVGGPWGAIRGYVRAGGLSAGKGPTGGTGGGKELQYLAKDGNGVRSVYLCCEAILLRNRGKKRGGGQRKIRQIENVQETAPKTALNSAWGEEAKYTRKTNSR